VRIRAGIRLSEYGPAAFDQAAGTLIAYKIPSDIRVSMLRTLSWFAGRADDGVFLRYLQDDRPAVRAAAAYVVGNLDPMMPESLLPLTADPEPRVRLAAAEGLKNVHGRNDVSDAFLRLRGDPDLFVRSLAKRYPVRTDNPNRDRLTGSSGDTGPASDRQKEAVSSPVTVQESRIESGTNPVLQSIALMGLQRSITPVSSEILIRALDDPDPAVQAAAVKLLAGRAHPPATDSLVRLADSPRPAIVRDLVRALITSRSPRAAAALIRLADEHGGDVLTEVTEAFDRDILVFEAPEDVRYLIPALCTGNSGFITAIVRIFKNLGTGTCPALLAARDSGDPAVARGASAVLTALGHHETAGRETVPGRKPEEPAVTPEKRSGSVRDRIVKLFRKGDGGQ
jgi:hypothetical protein